LFEVFSFILHLQFTSITRTQYQHVDNVVPVYSIVIAD